MRHFSTKKEANKFKEDENKKRSFPSLMIFKKIKGMKNRIEKPFLVGTPLEWLNQY